jgi:hypothetical protein
MSPHLAELIIGGAFASVEIGKERRRCISRRALFLFEKGLLGLGAEQGFEPATSGL